MPRQQATGASWMRFGTVPGNLDAPGGTVDFFTAGAALNIGDAVYLSAASTVNKSVVAGNQGKVCGVVVGGDLTAFEISDDPNDVGTAAASNGGQAIVLLQGKCYVTADAAIAPGVAIAMSLATAGRVRPATALAIAAGATAVTSAAANGTTDISGDGQNTIFGIARTNAAANGSVFLAVINAI